jgi:hypothetical protein
MIINAEPEYPDLNLLEVNANVSDFSAITDLFLCKPTFHFDSVANFSNRDYWNAGIVAGNIFPIHDIYEPVDQSEQISLTESKFNFRIKAKPGKYRFLLSTCVNLATYKKLVLLEGQNLKCFAADINGNVFGVLNGSEIMPFDIDPIIIDKIKWGSSDAPSWTNIHLSFLNPDQIKLAYTAKMLWEPSDLWNIEATMVMTGGYSTLFSSDFSSWEGSPTEPVGMDVVCPSPGVVENDSNRFKATIDGTEEIYHFWQLLTKSPNYGTGGVNYRLTFDIVQLPSSESYNIAFHHDTEIVIYTTTGTKVIPFSHVSDFVFFLVGSVNNAETANVFIIDNYLLESETGSIQLTVTRADGDPVSYLTASDISILDDVNVSVGVTSLTETSAGIYTLIPAEALSTGTITLLSDNYNGTYDYDL